MPLDFGIGEALAAFAVSLGVGAETAGFAAPIIVGGLEGAGFGAASSAITGGNPGQGALFGGLLGGAGAGLGELGGAAGAAGTSTGATFADSLTPATFGTTSGIIDAGGFDATFGGLAGAGAGAAGGIGADLGATFGDSLTPATAGTAGGGAIDGGAFTPPNPTAAPGVISAPDASAGITGPAATSSNAMSLGAAPTAPGPGAISFQAPTPAAAQSIDLTATGLGQNPGADVFTGAVDSSSAPASGAAQVAGDTFTPGGPAVTSAENAAALDTPFAQGITDTGIPAGGASASSSGGGLWNTIKGGVNDIGSAINSPTGKVASTALSLGNLGKSLLTANQPNPIPGMSQLQQIANQLGASGQNLTSTGQGLIAPNATAATGVANRATGQAATLENYLNTGTLPPAVQASLDQATNDAITGIKAQYAARGMPPGSSSEIQDINGVKQRAVIQGGTLAASLYSQGVSLDQMAAGIYENLTSTGGNLIGAGTSATGASAAATESLVNTNTALNTGLNNSIANLSSALGGGSKVIVNGQTVTT